MEDTAEKKKANLVGLCGEARVLRTGRRRDDGRRGFYVLLGLVDADDMPTVEDFFPVGGGERDALRAAELLDSVGSARPTTWRGLSTIVRLAPVGGDRPPRVVGYGGPEEAAAAASPRIWKALDALTGDRRRRRPEALARRRGAVEEPAPCERRGAGGAETHHDVWPQRAGGGDEMQHTERLCAPCHRKAEAAARADERAIRFGLHIAVVIGVRRVVGGWAAGLEINLGGWRRIFAFTPNRPSALDVGRPVAVLLEAEPAHGRRFRFRIAGAGPAEDDEAVDRIRARLIWGLDEEAS